MFQKILISGARLLLVLAAYFWNAYYWVVKIVCKEKFHFSSRYFKVENMNTQSFVFLSLFPTVLLCYCVVTSLYTEGSFTHREVLCDFNQRKTRGNGFLFVIQRVRNIEGLLYLIIHDRRVILHIISSHNIRTVQ